MPGGGLQPWLPRSVNPNLKSRSVWLAVGACFWTGSNTERRERKQKRDELEVTSVFKYSNIQSTIVLCDSELNTADIIHYC